MLLAPLDRIGPSNPFLLNAHRARRLRRYDGPFRCPQAGRSGPTSGTLTDVTTTIVVRVEDDDLSEADVHEALITALDLAGFRTWASYVADPGVALPEPRTPPPGWPW